MFTLTDLGLGLVQLEAEVR